MISKDVAAMTNEQLKSIANGNPELGYYNTDRWRDAATAELNKRGIDRNAPSAAATPEQEGTIDPISADAHFISMSASRDAGRIIKHLWIIFVLLPIVLAIVYVIMK